MVLQKSLQNGWEFDTFDMLSSYYNCSGVSQQTCTLAHIQEKIIIFSALVFHQLAHFCEYLYCFAGNNSGSALHFMHFPSFSVPWHLLQGAVCKM